MNWQRFTVLVPLFLILSACATLKPERDPNAETAARLMARCAEVNRTLISSRGIGRIAFTYAGRPQRLRFAWTSEVPAKLRVVVLGPDGRPLVTVAADGTRLYTHDHTTGEYRKHSQQGYLLKNALRLPLDVGSLTYLLAGRLPPMDFDKVGLLDSVTPPEAGVVLKKGWNRVGRVYVQPPEPVFTRLESYRRNGPLKYRIDLEQTWKVDEYTVPRRLIIHNDAGGRYVLEIDRYWANEPIEPGTFQLEPPQ